MVKIGPPGPTVNTLDIDPTAAYADTSNETLQIMNFFLEDLRPVEIEDLEPEDRRCPICSEEYTRNLHRAVRMPCKHCFGEPCIRTWLSPFLPWSPEAENPFQREARPPGANTCPSCRRVCFPRQQVADCLPEIDARIRLWDYVYAQAGIALSERERRAREDLLRYIDDYRARGVDEYYPSDEAMAGRQRSTFVRLIIFVLALDYMTLTPPQERLLRRLRDTAEDLDPDHMTWRRNDLGTLFFEYEGGWETETEEEDESDEEVEAEEEIIEGDSEEMRFFRALFR